jgi:hypothetical protein
MIVIAVDTNILVYAHRKDMPLHAAAARCLLSLATGPTLWAVPWPCAHEFMSVVTNPRIFREPTPLSTAIEFMQQIRDSGRCSMLAEAASYWSTLSSVLQNSAVRGGQIHDARIAAICLSYGTSELWSADRDFSRYPSLKVRNPLI